MNTSAYQFEVQRTGQTMLWPRWWRWTVITISVLTLCSCRSMPWDKSHAPKVISTAATQQAMPVPQAALHMGQPGSRAINDSQIALASAEVPVENASAPTLPPSAFTGEPLEHCPRVPMPGDQAVPFWASQWAPPGIARPWPEAEYLHDGGDNKKPAYVDRDWRIHGLESEDTIAHFDTLDGRVVVEPSNRVHLYAPRFGVVRRVQGLGQYEGDLKAHGGEHVVAALNQEQRLDPGAVLELQGPKDEVATRNPTIEQRDLPAQSADQATMLAEASGDLLPFEDFAIIRSGIAEQSDKPQLAIHVDAAIVWSHDLGVKVEIDGQSAQVETGDQRAQATFTVDNPNKAKLRIVKVASREAARPGDTVDFTLRFDNTGTEPIGNVTIVDNLTTRLEYVPESQESSLPGEFVTQINDSGSLVLRWEIKDPLQIGEGGTIRFRCKVR